MKSLFSFQSIRGRLNALGFLVFASLFLAGCIGILATYATQQSLERAYQNRLIPLRLLKVLSESYTSTIPNTIARMNNGELTTMEGLALVESARDSIQRCWREYQSTTLSPREINILQSIPTELNAADQEIEGMIRMLEVFQSQGKGLLSNQLTMVLNSLDPAVRPLSEKIDTLTQFQMDAASQEFKNSEGRYTITVILLIFIIIAVLGILYVAGMKMQKHIMGQLQVTLPALEEMGRGDLRIHIETHVHDEFADIAEGINRMAHSLRILVGRMAHGSSLLAECAIQFSKQSEKISISGRSNAANSSLTSIATSDASQGLFELSKNLSGIGESVERLVSEMERARQGVHYANQIGKDGAVQAQQATVEIEKAEQTLQQAYRHASDLNALFQVYLQATPGQDLMNQRMNEFLSVLHRALQSVHSLNLHQSSLAANAIKISESIHGINSVVDGSYQMLQTLHISTHGAARDMQESSKALVRIAATAEESRESALNSAKETALIQEKTEELKRLSEDLGQLARKFAI